MRWIVLAVALVVALVPLGVAQSESPSQGPSRGRCTEGSDADREACQERLEEFCEDDPDDRRCAAGNQTAERRPAEWCANGNRTHEQRERCREAVQEIRREERRHWVEFTVDAANATLLDYTVAGLLALDAIDLGLDQGNLTIQPDGSTLRVRAGDDELRLHDEPNGLIRFKGDGNVTLVFPANVSITPGPHGARIHYEEGRDGHLVADNLTWLDNSSVQLTAFFAFHVPPAAQAQDVLRELIRDVQVAKQDAIERRTVGAEITIKAREPAAAAMATAMDEVQVLAYDDVDVEVTLPAGAASPEDPLRVVVSSDLSEGRTIVLNVDEGLLAAGEPDLLLRYFDLNDDGSETEVYFFEAEGGLQDVLDASDDNGRPEYWIVHDANGVQVLVSVPHWSAHAITMASLSDLDVPSVLIGVSLGAAVTVGLGIAMLWPRRRDDEL